MTPETRYAKNGDAYQVTGQGEPMVFTPGTVSHLDLSYPQS